VLTSKLIFWGFFVSIGAVVVLVALDRRQPARRRHVVPRDPGNLGASAAPSGAATGTAGAAPTSGRPRRRPQPTASVRETPTRLYRRTPIWRRLVALGGLGVMGTVIGAVVAIVLAALAIALLLAVSGAAR
jgi:uncharacterized membrane protein YfcA